MMHVITIPKRNLKTVVIMWLFFLAIVLTICTPALSESSTSPALPKVLFKNCQVESGATRDDIESLKMRKVPKTKSGRCFLQCLFNTVRIMDDGKFNKHGMVIAFSPAMKGDLTKMGKLKELSEVCEHELGEKRYENCNGAKKIVECVARNGKAYGIEFPHPKNM